MRLKVSRPSPAMVVSLIALMVALGGSAYAAKIGASQLAKGSVTTPKISGKAVKTGKIADAAVTTAKIADDAVNAAKIAADAVTTAKIADNAVTSAKLVDDAVTTGKILGGAVTSGKLGTGAVTAAKLGSTTVREASGAVANNTTGQVIASCNAGEKIIGIGYFWSTQDTDLGVQNSFYFLNAAVVRGTNTSGAQATLNVQALCLEV